MLKCFIAYYSQNYAGILGSTLQCARGIQNNIIIPTAISYEMPAYIYTEHSRTLMHEFIIEVDILKKILTTKYRVIIGWV